MRYICAYKDIVILVGDRKDSGFEATIGNLILKNAGDSIISSQRTLSIGSFTKFYIRQIVDKEYHPLVDNLIDEAEREKDKLLQHNVKVVIKDRVRWAL